MRSLHPWPIFPPNLEPPAARSLSLLFILQEWIASLSSLEKLKETSKESNIASLSKDIEKFLLFSLETPFPQKGGFLDKLCFYFDILLQASKINDETIPMILEEMRLSILKLRSKFIASKKTPMEEPLLLAQAVELIQTLENKFLAFFSSLTIFLQEARTDENVLIYLIEQKRAFNRFLGPRAIESLLIRFFPAGQPHLRAVICEGFMRRGFASFLADKEPLIEELEWPETPR